MVDIVILHREEIMSTHIPLEVGKTWTFFHFRKIKVHQMFASNTGCPAILFFNLPQE